MPSGLFGSSFMLLFISLFSGMRRTSPKRWVPPKRFCFCLLCNRNTPQDRQSFPTPAAIFAGHTPPQRFPLKVSAHFLQGQGNKDPGVVFRGIFQNQLSPVGG